MGGPEWASCGVKLRPAAASLGRYDVGSLQTFRSLRHFELYTGAFIQGAISLRLDRREMHEDVFSVLPLDKTEALGRVKPLHYSFFFHLPIFLLNVVRSAPNP